MPQREQIVTWFLDNACAVVVNGPQARSRRMNSARRHLEQHPEIARDSIFTAVVCGDYDEVKRIVDRDPSTAKGKRPMRVTERDKFRDCDPLMYLCFARLTDPRATDRAVDIAKLLLDHGADPNGHFYFGDDTDSSKYTALCGVAGEGEEDAPPHRFRDQLARLLLERGAEPYDMQLRYNTHFHGNVKWMLELTYEFSVKAGRAADWSDPQWSMLGMGGYGNGARWFLGAAVRKNDIALATWILSHGASAEPDQPESPKQRAKLTFYQLARAKGYTEMASLLAQHGAPVSDPPPVEGIHALIDALRAHDFVTATAILAKHPDYLTAPKAMQEAVEADDVESVRFLLDAGVPVNLPDPANGGQTPLHVAGYKNALRAAALLVDRGAEIDLVEKNFDATPLGFAIYSRNQEMIALLSAVSRDVWEVTYVGNTRRLRELLAEKPDLARTLSNGMSPLHWLPDDERQAVDVVKLFLEHGADLAVRDAKGKRQPTAPSPEGSAKQ